MSYNFYVLDLVEQVFLCKLCIIIQSHPKQINKMNEESPVSKECSYVPSYNEAITNYEIHIAFLNRGMVIAVGCQKIAFESIEKGMEELVNYTKNPFQTQEKWREILK